eukprot:scaffold109526_cov48-Phaeocystis_antarctica.AAC.1
MGDEVQHNDGGFPLVKPNYSARSLYLRGVSRSLSLCAAANTCVSAWLARLSRRGILFLHIYTMRHERESQLVRRIVRFYCTRTVPAWYVPSYHPSRVCTKRPYGSF